MSGPRVYNVTVESSGTLYRTRLCPKKNWREASALNLWNPGWPVYDFYEKSKSF